MSRRLTHDEFIKGLEQFQPDIEVLDNGITLIRIPYRDYDNIESIFDEVISSQQRSQI